MKKLITIILAIIMTLLSTPQKATDEPPVTAAKPPQTVITVQVEQVPKIGEITAETAQSKKRSLVKHWVPHLLFTDTFLKKFAKI